MSMTWLWPCRGKTGPVLAPDRMAVWPIEGGRYGVDATYQGATGFERAEAQRRRLKSGHLRASVRQELSDGWTLRLGPLTRRSMEGHRSVHRSSRSPHGLAGCSRTGPSLAPGVRAPRMWPRCL